MLLLIAFNSVNYEFTYLEKGFQSFNNYWLVGKSINWYWLFQIRINWYWLFQIPINWYWLFQIQLIDIAYLKSQLIDIGYSTFPLIEIDYFIYERIFSFNNNKAASLLQIIYNIVFSSRKFNVIFISTFQYYTNLI